MDPSTKLSKLREVLITNKLNAVIVPTEDAHQSEYVADCDNRRTFISGFTGSAGTAIITLNSAALWTDGRYHEQAGSEISNDWVLMKEGLPGVPSQVEWLKTELKSGDRVSVDGTLYSSSAFEILKVQLASKNIELVHTENFVDQIWLNRPLRKDSSIFQFPEKYAGMTWQDKVDALRQKMSSVNCSVCILSALDDIAWLLNLRGADIDYNPVFFSYLVVSLDSLYLYVQNHEQKKYLQDFLPGVRLKDYNTALEKIPELNCFENSKVWITSATSHAIASRFKNTFKTTVSHVCHMKAEKSVSEKNAMLSANRKAAIVLSKYFSWVEQNYSALTECTAMDRLEELYSSMPGYQGLSFPTISSTGKTASIMHYMPDRENDRPLEENRVYLCDSGAQYQDGTTDTTRTLFLGPNVDSYTRECYTRVLKCHIGIAKQKFPIGTNGYQIDALARMHLWDVGLDFMHGTGHGVGVFLNVHEDPRHMGISYKFVSQSFGSNDDTEAGHNRLNHLRPNYVVTNEPGYYEPGLLGIRIENACIVSSEPVEVKYPGRFPKKFYQLESLIFLPYERKLIDEDLLDYDEKTWLNDYNQKCRDLLLHELSDDDVASAWVKRNTEKI